VAGEKAPSCYLLLGSVDVCQSQNGTSYEASGRTFSSFLGAELSVLVSDWKTHKESYEQAATFHLDLVHLDI
jgi:hypothetical protein